MSIINGLKEIGSFVAATALSCGPSQVFGIVKGTIDIAKLAKEKIAGSTLQNEYSQKRFGMSFTDSKKFKVITSKLKHEPTSEEVANYLSSKIKKNEEKVSNLKRSILADFVAMIPLVGAHFSWRIATSYSGLSYRPFFTRAMAQASEHYGKVLAKLLFIESNKNNVPLDPAISFENAVANKSPYDSQITFNIPVSTSTKNRTIKAFYSFADEDSDFNDLKGPTVVLFHGNGMTGGNMEMFASNYRKKGYNTLMVTIGGYPESPGISSSEKSVYQDIEAVKLFLQKQGVTQVGYHGLSLGGSLAFQAAAGETNADALETLFVVADQTFTSAKDVGGNVVRNAVSSAAEFLGRAGMSAANPEGRLVELPGGKWIKTDGLNSLAKIQKLKLKNIPLYTIKTTRDDLMGRNLKNSVIKEYKDNFADNLINARYDSLKERMEHEFTIEGGHCTTAPSDFYIRIPTAKR